MLQDLPKELLLNILDFLDNLDPLSSANRTLNADIRDYQASQLKQRLAKIPYIDLLIGIWSPPTFFHSHSHRHSKHRSAQYINSREELINVLCDPEMYSRVESYLSSLEHKSAVAARLGYHLEELVNTAGFTKSYAGNIVIYLWSAQQRFAHDPDGYIGQFCGNNEAGIWDVVDMDQYLRGLDKTTKGWVAEVYEVLSRKIRPPMMKATVDGAEPLWLYGVVVRDGMESVLRKLERRR